MSIQPEGPEPAAEPEMVLRDPVVAIVGGPDTRAAIGRLSGELNEHALTALRAQLSAALEDAAKWKRAFEIKAAALKRHGVCSGHSGKQPTDGECIMCFAERHERARNRIEFSRTPL